LNFERSFKTSALLALLLLSAHLAGGGALEQIKPISKLPEIDLGRLKQGDVVGARGPVGNFVRGIYCESAFFIHAPVPVAGEKFLRWNPAKHPGLEVPH